MQGSHTEALIFHIDTFRGHSLFIYYLIHPNRKGWHQRKGWLDAAKLFEALKRE